MKAFAKVSGLALVIALAGAMAAGAQPGQEEGPGFGMHRPPMERMLGPEGAHGRWWNNPNVIERLKLTDQQRKDMDQILLEHRESLIDMRASVEKAELAMDPLIRADQPNEQAILAQIDKIAQARAELEKANARFLLAIRSKLSPDQYKELQAWRNENHGPMGMHRWRDRGQGQKAYPGGNPGGPPSQPAPGPGQPPPGPPAAQPQSLLAPGPNPAPDSISMPENETVP